ncbi:hypothetical protein RSAG8_03467, partial [Rhizoctonia solani AG-8 WAC10335]
MLTELRGTAIPVPTIWTGGMKAEVVAGIPEVSTKTKSNRNTAPPCTPAMGRIPGLDPLQSQTDKYLHSQLGYQLPSGKHGI